ncbi:MAG TPA: hypothetical protein VGK74_22270 [Symbiobacteriaceae bacterium]
MRADNTTPGNPLDMSVFDPQAGAPDAGGPEFGGQQLPAGMEFGAGDLAPEPPDPSPTPSRRPVQLAEWQGVVRAIVADHTPAVGLRFRAWAARHRELIAGMPAPQALSLYVEVATFRDAAADEQRPEDDREYDWAELHMAGLRPLIEAEAAAQREGIADGLRRSWLDRLKELRDQGLVSDEALQTMQAGVSNG